MCGHRSEAIEKKLLSMLDLKFSEAIKTAEEMEAAKSMSQQCQEQEQVQYMDLTLINQGKLVA